MNLNYANINTKYIEQARDMMIRATPVTPTYEKDLEKIHSSFLELTNGTVAWNFNLSELNMQSYTDRKVIHHTTFHGCDCKGYEYHKKCCHKITYTMLLNYERIKDEALSEYVAVQNHTPVDSEHGISY